MDKNEFQMDIKQGQKFITGKGKKPAPLASSSTQEIITLIECVSGDGQAITLMLIVTGKVLRRIDLLGQIWRTVI